MLSSMHGMKLLGLARLEFLHAARVEYCTALPSLWDGLLLPGGPNFV